MKPLTPAALSREVEQKTDRLKLWRVPRPIETLLRVAELNSVQERHVSGPSLEASNEARSWQEAIATIVRWGTRKNEDYASYGWPDVDSRSVEAISTALKWAHLCWRLESIIDATRVGGYRFDVNGLEATLRLTTEPRYEYLAQKIGALKGTEPDLSLVPREAAVLSHWITSSRKGVEEMPPQVFHAALRVSSTIEALSPAELPPETPLDGFNLIDAKRIWRVVSGLGFATRQLLRVSRNPSHGLIVRPRGELVQEVARRARVDASTTARILEFLTFDPQRHWDPAIAPILEQNDLYVVSPTLVTMSSFDRNLLKLVATDEASYGRIGRIRGRLGTRQVANFFAVFPETAVASEVRAQAGREDEGDLDVVAVDLIDRIGVIAEVKSPMAPDSAAEIQKAEREIRAGQGKLARLRDRLHNGEITADFPADWPDFREITWTWVLICKGYLTPNPRLLDHDVIPTSWEVLWELPPMRLSRLIQTVKQGCFLPVEGTDFEKRWERFRVGPYSVKVETLLSLPGNDDVAAERHS